MTRVSAQVLGTAKSSIREGVCGGRGGFSEPVTCELRDIGLATRTRLEVNVLASGTTVLHPGGTMDLVGMRTRPEIWEGEEGAWP